MLQLAVRSVEPDTTDDDDEGGVSLRDAVELSCGDLLLQHHPGDIRFNSPFSCFVAHFVKIYCLR
jgi:hypothetical protein